MRHLQVVLRGGTHFLTETLHLGAEHAGLRMLAYPGETPTVTAELRNPQESVSGNS